MQLSPDRIALLESEILRLRMEGETSIDVARMLDLPHSYVLASLARLTSKAREETQGFAEELFMLANLRLERLWKYTKSHLDIAESFNDRLVRAAVSILERQSRLNGLDKGGKSAGASADDWVDQAMPKELASYMEQRGYPLGVEVPA